MKLFRIVSVVCLVIGLIMVYVGWNMGNGHFGGKAYIAGDYTTFKIGCLWLFGAVVAFLIPYFRPRDNKIKIKNTMKRFICSSIRVVASLTLIVGCLLILAGISQSITRYDGATYLPLAYIGIVCVLNFFVLYGFSYIVEASCRYLNKLEGEE